MKTCFEATPGGGRITWRRLREVVFGPDSMVPSLQDWRDFVALTKPRVMSLVVFTGLCGLLVAPVAIHPVLGFTAVLCIALGAGSAAALNMWYEADIDALMQRTKSRPIPAGRMDPGAALHFGVGLGVFSVLLMGLATNWFAAGVLAASILFYVFVYTVWLKRRTPQNIVIGGAAGAIPPVVGWAAATGSLTLPALLLFLIVFFWTPPHFWALALLIRRNYEAAGVPMLPVVRGERETAVERAVGVRRGNHVVRPRADRRGNGQHRRAGVHDHAAEA